MGSAEALRRAWQPVSGGLLVSAAVLVAATLPFYALGPLLGSLSPVTGSDVPGAALMFACPAIAALAAARHGSGARAFLLSLRQPVPRTWWWVAALGALPAVVAVASGGPLGGGMTVAQLCGLAAVYVLSAAAEEAGWSGYVHPRLLPVLGELGSSLVIGAVWGLWHVVPWVQRGDGAPAVAAHFLFTVAFRVVLGRFCTAVPRGGLWLATAGHASLNIAWAASPNSGADYDPLIAAGLTFLLAAVLLLSRSGARRRT
ncbi:CPBP family intramembrane glutamic endopeptidase [Nocardiopsis coralliicola]